MGHDGTGIIAGYSRLMDLRSAVSIVSVGCAWKLLAAMASPGAVVEAVILCNSCGTLPPSMLRAAVHAPTLVMPWDCRAG